VDAVYEKSVLLTLNPAACFIQSTVRSRAHESGEKLSWPLPMPHKLGYCLVIFTLGAPRSKRDEMVSPEGIRASSDRSQGSASYSTPQRLNATTQTPRRALPPQTAFQSFPAIL